VYFIGGQRGENTYLNFVMDIKYKLKKTHFFKNRYRQDTAQNIYIFICINKVYTTMNNIHLSSIDFTSVL